jgi:hypothetical protein
VIGNVSGSKAADTWSLTSFAGSGFITKTAPMSKKALLIPMAVWFLAYGASQCKTQLTMSTNFCDHLKTDNWQGLKKDVNAYLHTIKPQDGPEANFKKIADWIREHDCVTNVTIQPGEIRTYPPQKQIAIDVKDNGGTLAKTIGISFSDKRYEINIH